MKLNIFTTLLLICIVLLNSGCAYYATSQLSKYESRKEKQELLDTQTTPNNIEDGHTAFVDLFDLWDWEDFKKHPIIETIALLIDLFFIYKIYLL